MATRNSTGATRAKRHRKGFTHAEIDRFFRQLERSKPILTEGDISRVDDLLIRGPHARNRRVAMMILTRPGKFVVDWAQESREQAVSMADGVLGIRETVKAMRQLTEMMEAAEWRLAMALCYRDDMKSVYAEAKASGSAGTEEAANA